MKTTKHNKHIQLFARTRDLIPADPPMCKPLDPRLMQHYADPDEETVYHDKETKQAYWDCFRYFLQDIRAHGMKYAINIDPYGRITDGDCRYWIAVLLGWEYVPVTIGFKRGKKQVHPPRLLPIWFTEDGKEIIWHADS